ncbi:hypothetical protein DH2020_000501 [Rehmannia glutinosa]|uniref:Protein kinase domain-containing protein n=1 Tax=Rehmannia glutinosa TaxID=99300 RepID=A0ABR0XWT6_REHGL
MEVDPKRLTHIVVALLIFLVGGVICFTDPNDFKILNDFRNGLENPDLLKWPSKGNNNDPCGPPAWPHVFCSNNGRVTQIQVQNLGLKGPLPQNMNQLDKLQNVGLQRNNFNGKLPSFSGLSDLQYAYLDFNEFDTIPADFFHGLSNIRVLALDNNPFNQSTGWSIPSELAESTQLILWLNNQDGGGLTGSIDVIGTMVGLTQVWLHGNQFTGSIPDNIGSLTSLKELNLNRNRLVGLIPSGLANLNLQLLDLSNNMLMGSLPKFKAAKVLYDSNSFCQSDPGAQCAPEVNALLGFLRDVNYPENSHPRGLVTIHVWDHEGNNLHGILPSNLTLLNSLRLLNLSGNDFEPPLPKFNNGVNVVIDHNPKLNPSGPPLPPSPNGSPSDSSTPSSNFAPSEGNSSSPNASSDVNKERNSIKSRVVVIVASSSAVFTVLAIVLAVYCLRKRKKTKTAQNGVVIHPKDSSNPSDMVKIAIIDTSSGAESSRTTDGSDNARVIEAGNLVFSLQSLRKVTNDFARENELGRGGFGVVYKGELENGMNLAVKRMESGEIGCSEQTSFPLEEFEFGAFVVDERLNIALDVARGVEYLHSLAHQSFIHRDLKSANILLDDDFRAKVSDFGLVKLALDTERSVATRLAGTFGYLAPEYAVTGKITTKVDVFSFGVILMELLTGLVALDERRPEEKRYLAEWFWQIKSNRDTLIASIDPALDVKEDIYESIFIIAELAGHCTAREANYRPEMGHAVNVLAQLVEKWKPYEETDNCSGINLDLPLPQLLKGWQEEGDTRDFSGTFSQDSKGSIPAKPSGICRFVHFADAANR